VRGPPHREQLNRDRTVRVEPFVRPDESLRSAAFRDAVARSLDQLMRLALEKGESQTSFAWLHEVRSTLSELRCHMSDRAGGGAWSNGCGIDALRRPELADQLDQFIEENWLHLAGLDRLLADAEHVAAGTAPNLIALRKRLTAWLERQQRLSATGPELIFGIFWDDLGGEG
jgi:hypothetical protein